MSKFKVGDRVKCVDAREYQGHLTLGKIYEVVQTSPEFAWVDDDRGTRFGYYDSRFELAESEKEQPSPTPRALKVGDVVKCIDNAGAGLLTEGHEYTVEEIESDGFTWVINDSGIKDGFFPSRFELVAETGQEPDKSGQEPKFQVGQLIRCKAAAEDLTIGFLYEVLSHDPEGDPYVENDEGDSKPYSSTLFQDSQEPWETSPFNADYASIEQSVQATIDRSTLIYNYLDAKRDFEAAMTSYNEACQAIRDKLKDGERFVYTRYSEAYIVQRDKDGFTVDKIDMV